MATQRACDVCGFFRQGQTFRYGLSRQLPRAELKIRGGTRYYRSSSYGGIDLCNECWARIAKPKTRPELLGKTGPKENQNGSIPSAA